MGDVRCENKLHGIIVKPGVLEVKCDSRFCGANANTVVLHRFDLETGDLMETIRFKEPARER